MYTLLLPSVMQKKKKTQKNTFMKANLGPEKNKVTQI